MSWLPKRDKLDPVQASAIDVAVVVRELIYRGELVKCSRKFTIAGKGL